MVYTLLPELPRGVVGGVALARQEGVEHQAPAGSQATGGQLEQAAQLLRRPEVRHHLGEHDQLIVPAQIIHGRKDVALDDVYVE